MLKQMRNIHAGKTFAVLGSAPSLPAFFKRQQDIIIGVNGASSKLHKGDYFLSNDEAASKCAWFPKPHQKLILVLPPISAMYVPVMYPEQKQRQTLILAYERALTLYPEAVKYHKDGTPVVAPGHPVFDAMFEKFPLPAPPHFIFRHIVHEGQIAISREQEAVIKMGTSVCVGVQLAYVMGASEIHLYGVDWSNSKTWDKPTSNYYSGAKVGVGGVTTYEQAVVMDNVARVIIEQGTPVYVHGPTKLKVPIPVL